MGRTLPLGRNTKQDPGETIRKAGLIEAFGNKGIFGDYLDQLLFEGHGVEHILGSSDQLSAEFATITWNQALQRFEDFQGWEVVLDDWDRVAVIGMNTLTDDLVIDDVENLALFHIGNTPGQSGDNPKFQLGDAGSGVPYKIFFGSNTSGCKVDILTDKPFDELELSNLTQAQKQYIANQGKGNHISVNGETIYGPSEAGTIVKFDTVPANPYLLRMNGANWPWATNAAVDGLAWFRDLNIKLNGQRWTGSAFAETQSRFTLPATISASPYLFQLNTAKRFMTDVSSLDTRVHSRTDPTGVSVAATGSFVSASNVVTFAAGIGNIKNGMRINGASARGIPDAASGTPGTTVLRNIDTTAKTAEMYNALTGAAVNATSTGDTAVTMNNSGAAGGSHDGDFMQNILGQFDIHRPAAQAGVAPIYAPTGAFTATVNGSPTTKNLLSTQGPATLGDRINFDASGSINAHDQTQPQSAGIYYYYKA